MNRESLLNFLEEFGFGVLLDPNQANDLYPEIATGRDQFLGLQMAGAAQPVEDSKLEVIAAEPIPDHAIISDTMSESNLVPKIGFSDKKIGFLRFNEKIDFTADELELILKANSLPYNHPKVMKAAELIITNVSQLVTRRDTALERQFWQSCTGQVNLPTKNGVNLTYFTGITDLGTAANLWSDTVNATPYDDLNEMADALEDQGFTVEKFVMNRKTGRAMLKTAQVIENTTDAQRQLFAQGAMLTDVNGNSIQIYNGAWLAKNIGTAGRQLFIADGEVIAFGSRGSSISGHIGLFSKPNVDPTFDVNAPAFTYGEYFNIKTVEDPTAIRYRYSFEGGIGVINPEAIKKKTVL